MADEKAWRDTDHEAETEPSPPEERDLFRLPAEAKKAAAAKARANADEAWYKEAEMAKGEKAWDDKITANQAEFDTMWEDAPWWLRIFYVIYAVVFLGVFIGVVIYFDIPIHRLGWILGK